MPKEIVPYKLIAKLNEDGTFKNGVLQYRLKIDGALQSKFYTMAINEGVKIADFNFILSDSKAHAEKGEKLEVVGIVSVEAERAL